MSDFIISQEPNQQEPSELLKSLLEHFDLSGLKMLCFNLGIEFEDLPGETRKDKARELVQHMKRHGRLSELGKSIEAWPFKKGALEEIDRSLAPRSRALDGLLRLVDTIWIEGVLNQSLHTAVLLQLDLTYTPDAVVRRQPYVLRQAGQTDIPVPVEQSIIELFEAHGRNLLILGDPGSGKTFTLLQLAQSLIQQAEVDPRRPIPVVLNLASWAEKRGPLIDWIVAQMLLQYQAARKVSRTWLKNNALLLLLDGLDEVDEAHRDACIVAINDFKANYATDVVVCSRIADYERLKERLNLSTAVTIQPLTEAEIDHYLAQEELELQAVRTILKTDSDLRVLTQSPLMLTIMTLSYRGLSLDDFQPLHSIAARRHHLFTEYAARVFERRPLTDGTPYKQSQALRWLSYLAAQMSQRTQTEFFIERLQPDWILQVDQKRLYRLTVVLTVVLIFGLIGGLIIVLIGVMLDELIGGLIVVLIIGLSVGFGKIKAYEKVIFSWKYGLIIGLIGGVLGGWLIGERGFALLGLLSGVLIGGLIGGLIGQELNTEGNIYPNQGIWQSGKNAARVGLIFGLVVGLSRVLFWVMPFGLSIWLKNRISYLMIDVPFVGLSTGLVFGGSAFIQHFVLRYILQRCGYLPGHRLVPFLDEMAARILLRKIGGGYIFIHRTLQEYFAQLYEES